MKRRVARSLHTGVLLCGLLLMPALSARSQENAGATAGSIRGTITISANDDVGEDVLLGRTLTRYAAHGHHQEQAEPYRLSEKAVVYIDDIEGGDSSRPPAVPPRLNQSQMMFRPLVLPVMAGTAVDFPNNDNVYHNVFSYSQTKEFDLGRYPTGQKRTVVFDTPGVVKVYCDIHSHMYAIILVLKNRYYTVPNEDGSFAIADVPEGMHTVVFWYGRKEVVSKKVLVRGGAVTEMEFSY
jgi:plastocyanin